MKKIRVANFEKMLQRGELHVPPLEVRVIAGCRGRADVQPDATIDVTWRGKSCRYVVELKRDAKPQTLKLAVDQVKQYAQQTGSGRPMVVAPYLTGEKLDQLLAAGVSALDFCGNAAVEAPGLFLFYKTGNPNRFADSSPIRSAYRGDGSLVARVILLQREFGAISDILTAIRRRGGSLAMGTVSKVLQRLESDLVIDRPSRRSVRLIQPEKLLDQLLGSYQPPKIESVWTGKVALSNADLLSQLERLGKEASLVRTGESSAIQYATYAGEPIVACYSRAAPDVLLKQLGVETKETRGFANLQLIQTDDQRVYFDRRPQLAASPIQAWLEMAGGDKRQKEVAEQIKAMLLDNTGLHQ